MNDYRPELPLLTVGDRLIQRLNKRRHYSPEDVTVQVIRVGRAWGYARKLEDLDREWSNYDIKFDKKTGYIHGGGYSSPGRVGSEAQFAWDDRNARAVEYLKSKGFEEWDLRRTPYSDNKVRLANMVAADQGDKPI